MKYLFFFFLLGFLFCSEMAIWRSEISVAARFGWSAALCGFLAWLFGLGAIE